MLFSLFSRARYTNRRLEMSREFWKWRDCGPHSTHQFSPPLDNLPSTHHSSPPLSPPPSAFLLSSLLWSAWSSPETAIRRRHSDTIDYWCQFNTQYYETIPINWLIVILFLVDHLNDFNFPFFARKWAVARSINWVLESVGISARDGLAIQSLLISRAISPVWEAREHATWEVSFLAKPFLSDGFDTEWNNWQWVLVGIMIRRIQGFICFE